MTAMDFRQYDAALGRFMAMDRLTELVPDITPYRFAFNNPNYWSDPSGLFETRNAALAHINEFGLSGATVTYNSGSGLWTIHSGGYSFYQRFNNSMVVAYNTEGGGVGISIINGAGGWSMGSAFAGGADFGGAGSYGLDNYSGSFNGINSGVNSTTPLTYAGNSATIGNFLASALSDRAAYNATKVYTYGTKTVSATQLTAQNAKQMGNISKVAGSIGTKIGVAGIGLTIFDDYRNDNLGAGTVAKTAIGVLSVAFPGFGLVYGFADIITLATTGTSLTNHIGNAVDNSFK